MEENSIKLMVALKLRHMKEIRGKMFRKILYLYIFVIFVSADSADNEVYYDSYTGNTITFEQYKNYVNANISYWCAGKHAPCQAEAYRNSDGSCNNLKYPARGTPHTPFIYELPLVFGKDNEPVKLKNGEKLDPRKVRLETLIEGDVPDQRLTILIVHFLLLGFGNIGSFHDTVNYVHWRPYCCQPKGKNDSMCYPMKVADDDVVHQFSDIRCFNNTRPLTFQSFGCLRDKSSTPERLNSGRTYFELGIMYSVSDTIRTFENGMLKVEMENGKVWPASRPAAGTCLLNRGPRETRCHKAEAMNSLFGLNFLGIIFWRHHNFIAENLKKVNPCWDDEKLFQTARDINIAQFAQIQYYEALPQLMGLRPLLREGVISPNAGFRDIYQKDLLPQMSLEYTYVLRWLHTVQPGNINLYDSSGNYLSKVKVTNTTFRTGMFPLDGNMEGFTQGAFRQPAAKFDHVIDPILAQNALHGLQRAFDLPAADLMKEGLFGLQPYTAYRKLCTGKTYKTFEDLAEDVEPVNLEMMKSSFKYVEDVPLMVGLWLEKHIPGGSVPRTYACLSLKQLKRFIQYDRHWYERPNRPHAFTQRQLGEIRKSTIARVFCNVGDSITSITPNAFLREGRRNKMTDCSLIPSHDFGAWKDYSATCSE